MRIHTTIIICLLLALVLLIVPSSHGVPLSMVINSPGIVIPNNALEDAVNGGEDDDDFTTHPLERLSSAATCLVAGVEYTHGQQIYRRDPCEFCLCLDGEMFCWWQDCPPAMDGPCKDRGPFTPCQNGAKMELKPTVVAATKLLVVTTSAPSSFDNDLEMEEDDETTASTDLPYDASASSDTTDFTPFGGDEADTTMPLPSSSSTTPPPPPPPPTFCTVMGRTYNIGERLPHDTGNCVECICGAGAQITCSPHQCGPPSDDLNEYRPPGLRSAQPDVF